MSQVILRQFEKAYVSEAMRIWNEVVEEGVAFPQLDLLDEPEALEFFREQTYTGLAIKESTDQVLGLYILHPNNTGRCGHIANASFAVRSESRGLHIGEKLVTDCLEKAKENGFRLMQFNAVVDRNIHARHLYKRLGFQEVGMIPGGFLMKDGHYENIHVMYKEL
ncbi:MAG: GNAT family N-acetyltransferase [Lachnospiraceae bacterium]|nr:GNAT family N-acetyltransferase [Lachnospiraceae bacterium]